MARLNIEAEWFSDPRRFRLAERFGFPKDPDGLLRADGRMVMVWHFAQQYWFKKELIPEHAWIGAGLGDEVFSCGLAERRPEGIYVRGSSRHFDWYFEKCERLRANASLGGKHSAEARLKKYGTANPRVESVKQTRTEGEAISSNVNPSSSSSSSSSSSKELTTKAIGIALPQLASIWNANRLKLSEAKKSSPSRNRKASARWRENPDPDYWAGVVKRIAANEFCNGKNDRGWRATFDWLIQPDTHLNVMEGKYDGHHNRAINTKPLTLEEIG